MTIEYSEDDPDFPDLEPEEHRIERSNDLDLEFQGWLVGEKPKRVKGGDARILIRIYYTVTKKLVATVEYEDFVKKHYKLVAEVSEEPEIILQWLKDGNKGKLGPAGKSAWEQACEEVPALEEWSTLRV